MNLKKTVFLTLVFVLALSFEPRVFISLSVYFFAVACVKDFYKLICIIDRIYNSVISYSDAVVRCVVKFFRTERFWLVFKKDDFLQKAVSNLRTKLFKLSLSAGNYLYAVTHLWVLCLWSSLKKSLSGLELSLERLFAIAISMISSLKVLFFTSADKNTLFSCLGRALKAVRNTSAVACSTVIFKSSTCFNIKYTLFSRLCQAFLISLVFLALSLEPSTFSLVYAASKGADPVAYWRFDEGGGGTAYDESANNNDGTLSAGASGTNTAVGQMWTRQGKIGGALECDGADDYVTKSFSVSGTEATIMFWIKNPQYVTGPYLLRSDANVRTYFDVLGDSTLTFYKGDPSVQVVTVAAPAANAWTHLTMKWWNDAGQMKARVYINGQAVGSDTNFSNSGNGSYVTVGGFSTTGTQNAAGIFDDLKVYNYARTADQIMVDYNAGSAAHLGAGTDPNEGNPPVGYWPLDENTGTITYDRSGNGNNGTIANATWAQGKRGSALSFNASNADISAGTGIHVTTNAVTLEAWIYPTVLGGDYRTIVQKRDSTACEYEIYLHTTNKTLSYFNGTQYISTYVPPLNTWTHVVATNNAGTLKLYANGAEVYSITGVTIPTGSPTAPVYIGRIYTGGERFGGMIDEVKIYDYARTLAQITYDYNKGKPVAQYKFDEGGGSIAHNEYSLSDTGASPVVWWRMDEGTGTSVSDQSGYGNTGTFGNTPAWVSGKIGPYAVSFDSTDDYVIKNPVSNFPTTEITAEFWIKTSDTGNKHPISYASSKGDNDFLLNDLGQGVLIGGTTCSTGVTYNDGNWHHVGITWKSSNGSIKVYKDGAQAYSGTHQQGYSLGTGGSLVLAQDQDSVGGGFDPAQAFLGQLDDVRIYNYVRTGEQIYNDYKTTQGTLVGDTKFVDGKIGKALQFDGTGDYVDCGNNIIAGSEQTWSAWVKRNSAVAGFILDQRESNIGYQPLYINAGGDIQFYSSSTANGDYFDTNISTEEWAHIALVLGSSVVKCYVNGRYISEKSDNCYNFGTKELTVGIRHSLDSGTFDGLIDNVRIYNYARTSDQIMQDYAQGASRLGGQNAGEKDPWSGNLPVAHWKMDENTGVRAYDASGNGNNGTVSGAAWTQGKNGPALTFDGTNDYVDCGNGSSLNISNAITIEAWIKPVGAGVGTYSGILGRGLSNSWGIFSDKTPGALYFRLYNNSGTYQQVSKDNVFTLGNWIHVVAVYDGALLKTYANGNFLNSISQTGTIQTTENVLQIGDITDRDYPFNGLIDDVRIYNYVRTPAQIAWDYNHGKPVAHYRFDEGSGITAYDDSDNNNDGTISIGGSGAQATIGAAWTNGATGKYNGSLNFDGNDDYVNVQNGPYNSFGTLNFTVSSWIKTNSSSIGLIAATATNITGWRMGINNGKPYYLIGDGTHYHEGTIGSQTINNSSWHLITNVYLNSDKVISYIDGIYNSYADVSDVTGSVSYGTAMGIGSYPSGAGWFFSGQIDDVRIYNYARTADQILQDYNNGAAARLGD